MVQLWSAGRFLLDYLNVTVYEYLKLPYFVYNFLSKKSLKNICAIFLKHKMPKSLFNLVKNYKK